MRLKDKVVIVTGSARGLGRTFASGFSREGAKVVVCGLHACGETVKEIESGGGEVLALKTDVTSEESTLELAKKTFERFGRIDVLVNNAAFLGGLVMKPFYQVTEDEWDRVMTKNLKGMFLCCKAVFPFMRDQGKGKIINMASTTHFNGTPNLIHYTTSKGGVIAFTRAMARELGEYNINVNAVAPGLTVTEAGAQVFPEDVRETVVSRRSFKREEEPADLLGAMIFLSSEDSDFITGQTIVVDGGTCLH